MLNNITIMGRLTRDPELRRTGAGIAVCSFSIACDRDYTDKEKRERETDFIDCVAWRGCGEMIAKYFTKGRLIVLQGRLEIRSWTDKDGNKRRTAEIRVENAYFGDSKRSEGADAQPQGGYATPGYQMPPNAVPAPAQQGGYQMPANAGQPATEFIPMPDDDDAQLCF